MTTRERPVPPNYLPGDLLAFSRPGLIGRLIRVGTWGPVLPKPCRVNHVAICGLHPILGTVVEYESTMSITDWPCVLQNRVVKGVQAHPIDGRLEYEAAHGGTVWHYPLTRPLGLHAAHTLSDWLDMRLGAPYDYWGALYARSAGLGWLSHCLHDRLADTLNDRTGLGNLFCSELGAGVWDYVGIFKTANPSKWSPAALCYHAAWVRRCCRRPRCVVRDGEVLP